MSVSDMSVTCVVSSFVGTVLLRFKLEETLHLNIIGFSQNCTLLDSLPKLSPKKRSENNPDH